jgi:hypothetical protein
VLVLAIIWELRIFKAEWRIYYLMLLFEAKRLLNFVGLEVEALQTYDGCSLIFVLIFGLAWSHGFCCLKPCKI